MQSMRSLRRGIEVDARTCHDNSRGMEASSSYKADLKKTLDTDKTVVIEVSGNMICDGVHPSSYRYGVAFEKQSGKRLDLNRIYNIAIRQDDHLFLRHELADTAKISYERANAQVPSCLNQIDDDGLTSLPMTFSPNTDGSLSLYYSAPGVSAACYPVLVLERSAVAAYRNADLASQYHLP